MAGLEERTVSEEKSPALVCPSEGASLGGVLAALVRERRAAHREERRPPDARRE